MNINFEKSTPLHKDTIFNWLAEPHVQEFWDNSQEHKDNILDFIHGRKQRYFYGTTQYWIASIDGQPYGFILSDILQEDQDMSDIHKNHLSKSGHTIAIDFCIGSKNHLGKGLATLTLDTFVNFYQKSVDPQADTFFIDPEENNPRAKHVYSKAGFEQVGEFDVQSGIFKSNVNHLMVRKI